MDPEDPSSAFHPDDDSPWFEKNVDVGQSASSLTESTDHDELSTEFTQDELNAELTQSDEHSELTNDDDLMTEKMDHQEHDVLSQSVRDLQSTNEEIASSGANLQDAEQSQSADKTSSQSETLDLERELLEESNLSLEGKKDDITKELTDIFFQTEHKSDFTETDLSEVENKVDTLNKDQTKDTANDSDDHLLSSHLENEAEMSDDTLKNELTNILDEDKLLNPELESKALDVVQELQEHIKLAGSEAEKHDEIISMEPSDIQSSLDKICLVTKDVDGEFNESFDPAKEENETINESNETISDEVNPEITSEHVSEKLIVNTIDEEELSKEPVMLEFTHDNESRAKIKVNKESDNEETTSKFVVSDTKQPVLNAETIVMETEEGEQIVFNAEVISTENNSSIMNVEGGAEFLEAVTGNIDDLMDTEEDPLPEPPVVRKKPEQPKCFVSSCKSGKTGSRTSFRYFKPPVTNYFLKKWQSILEQGGDELTPDSTICELHFKSGHIYKKSIDEAGSIVWGLREGAIPTVHNTALSKTLFKTVNIPKMSKMADNSITPTITVGKNVAVFNSKAISSLSKEPAVKTPKVLQKPRPTVKHIDMSDPEYIVHNPDLIKNAQDEILSLDVLVCGDCRSVFHFVEDFAEHKRLICNGKSTFKANPTEPKAQVWAFLLWKSAQAKVLTDIESPWKLYQRWCKMDDNVREAWITAGKTLMDSTALAHLKIADSTKTSPFPAKVGRPPGSVKSTPVEVEKSEDDDEAHNTNVIMRKVRRVKKGSVKETRSTHSDSYMEDTEDESRHEDGGGDATERASQEELMETESEAEGDKGMTDEQILNEEKDSTEEQMDGVEIKEEVMSEEEQEDEDDDEVNKENQSVRDRLRVRQPQPLPITKNKPTSNKQTNVKTPSTKKTDEEEEEEFVVEKIVSRRYNSKKRQFEYLLKWEGYPSEQNTWEPEVNMATCQHLLKAFEAGLVKQQQSKQAPVTKTPVQPKKKTVEPVSQPGPSGVTSQGRPDRRSKQKAMDQVKVWCGSMKPTDDEYGVGVKRKFESDSDFDDEEVVSSKKVKVERDNENIDAVLNRTPAGTKKFVKGPKQVGRPESDRKTHLTPGRPALNGFKKESNLAAALGLESDSENDSERGNVPSPSPEKSQPVVRKMSSLSVQNQQVLVANAKGVVKVDPSQVPNLTSGVYIMSNTSGIIKVDNKSSKNALSSLQKQGVIKKSPAVSNTSPPPLVMVGNKDGNATPQKSGIIRRQQPVPILPKLNVTTLATPRPLGGPLRLGASPRPMGMLKSLNSASPRLPGIPSGLSTKIQSAVRPKGTLPLPSSLRPKPATPLKPSPIQAQKPQPLQKLTPPPQKPSPLQKLTPLQKPTTPLQKATPLQKPTLKPIESILGGGLQASQQVLDELDLSQFICLNPQPPLELPAPKPFPEPVFKIPAPLLSTEQKMLLARKKALGLGATPTPSTTPKVESSAAKVKVNQSEEVVTRSPVAPAKKILSHPLVFRNRGRGGLGGRGGLPGRGRGGLGGRGSSLGALLRMDQSKEIAIKESKLVENDNLLMEFREESDSNDSDDGGLSDHFPDLNDPIEPESPPRPLSLCPLTGKVLCKAEGEKTPEPTPPPSPKPPTPPPPEEKPEVAVPFTLEVPSHQPASILPDEGDGDEEEDESVMKGMMCKVEMSPGGTTGTVLETGYVTPANVTEGTVTIKRSASPHAVLRGPQLSVLSGANANTSLGTITVPARKIFQDESGTITTDDDVVTITGEDGLVYQVSNADMSGNTILMSSGEDGQQQCVYVTAEATEGGGDESTILTLDTAYADAVAQLGTEQFYIKEDGDGELVTLEGEEGTVVGGDDQGGQVVAQLVEAGEPAPGGGPRRVVLLLPDGNLMMTEVDEEQYAALDLDKCKLLLSMWYNI